MLRDFDVTITVRMRAPSAGHALDAATCATFSLGGGLAIRVLPAAGPDAAAARAAPGVSAAEKWAVLDVAPAWDAPDGQEARHGR